MAVTIKKKELTIKSLVKRLFSGSSTSDLITMAHALEANGYYLTTAPSTLTIEDKGNVLAKTEVKLSAVQKALKGKLTFAGKTMLTKHIEQFILKAYALMPEAIKQKDISEIYDQTMEAYHSSGGGNKVKAIKIYRNLTGSSLKDAKDKVEAWIDALQTKAAEAEPNSVSGTINLEKGTIDIDDDEPDNPKYGVFTPSDTGVFLHYSKLDSTPVLLEDATALHQPVKGTSGGSIYHVIALGANAKVAARIKNTDVAIRVHPVNNAGRAACKLAGLDEKSGGHWSLHLHPDNKLLVNKCVGAVLFAMGLNFDAISGNLEAIVGAGK